MSFTAHLTDSYWFSQSKIVSADNDDGKATSGCSLATRSHHSGWLCFDMVFLRRLPFLKEPGR